MSYLLQNYERLAIEFTHGRGVFLWDKNGQKYLDFLGGIAVNILGTAHPQLVKALNIQAKKLWHTCNLYAPPVQNAGQEQLAEKLCKISGLDRLFLCNSGTEANEAMIKIARRYFFDTKQEERTEIITFGGAFHGRTMGALSATGNSSYLKGFGKPLEGFTQIAINNTNELGNALSARTAGIMLEVIQGEGGLQGFTLENLRHIRQFCDEHRIILMIDEIQTGMGRTGKFFAHQWAGIQPDIISLAKGLGGGFPIGAVLMHEKLAQYMTPGTHGTTFGGNALGVAVANQVIDIINQPAMFDHVIETGDYLGQKLRQLQQKFPHHITALRGQGLMQGFKLADTTPNATIYKQCAQMGLLVGRAGDNVIRLLPPLTINKSHVNMAYKIFHTIFKDSK